MSDIQKPKLVVIGAGSLFFGRQAIWQMVHSPHLNSGTLALVDKDPQRLEKMGRLAELAVAEAGVKLRLETASDWRAVLPGADFVALSFAVDTVRYRGIDCAISEKHGVRMCSGDTIGPGGIFRAMRELPLIMDCVADIERLCPAAWVINYINPSAVNGMAIARYAPAVKSFALCDSLHMPHVKARYAKHAGIIEAAEEWNEALDAAFDLRIAGVNHFTWMLRAAFRGRDVTERIAETLRQDAAYQGMDGDKGAKALHNNAIAGQLYQIFGYVPVCVSHTKEYLRFYQGHGVLPDEIPPLKIWETETRYARHEAMWQGVDEYISGARPMAEFMAAFGPDHATDVIENMVGGLGRPFYINTQNRGAVGNMADDAFLELLCDVDMDGPQPRLAGDMPRGLRGLQEVVLDTHELTAEAIVKADYGLLRRALMTDPLTNSIADADAILRELLAAERDALPDHWYMDGRSPAFVD
ncbi:MAG: glycoside hydrolase family 4 [Chloroflexota bacterium]|nr:glycoside hydrolase family 4 [Chloroflexota bacterium]MDE2946167.1 glycoside hydrolase family 4 [Chloroflexota bacterium]